MIDERDPNWGVYVNTNQMQSAYKNVFGPATPGGKTVLADLARYCFAFAPTTTEREAGMRDVWLFIEKRLRLTHDEFFAEVHNLTPHDRISLFDRKPYIKE